MATDVVDGALGVLRVFATSTSVALEQRRMAAVGRLGEGLPSGRF